MEKFNMAKDTENKNIVSCKLKKVVFVISSLEKGGAERVISQLANYFSEIGIQVSIVLISNNIVKYKLDDAINIIPIDTKFEHKHTIFSPWHRIELIRNQVKSIKPDVVISFLTTVNIYTCLALGLSKYNVVISERANPEISALSKIKKITRKLFYPLANGIVFQTEQAKNYFPQKIQDKSVIIENPIMKNLPKQYTGIRKKKIVAMGNLRAIKNYGLLIEAFNQVKKNYDDFILEIYGEGTQRENLENLIDELDLADAVYLKRNTSDVHSRISDAAMYVLTSNSEGMPNALIEAMSMGLPCISTDCPSGGPRKLINHNENGMLFSVGNKEELVCCIQKVIEDKAFAEKIGTNAMEINNELKLEYIAQKWLDYINSLN